MSLNKSIGGYFELELPDFGSLYHDEALLLNSGRNALEYILSVTRFSKVYLPYYICEVITQPLERLNIDFKYYHLDNNLLPVIDSIENNEALLYVNYFGLMNSKIKSLCKEYKNVIVDNSQAFYSKPVKNVPTFYSPRKFFGLPDGGIAYAQKDLYSGLEQDYSQQRLSHLIERIEEGPEKGYKSFVSNEAKFELLPLRKMSKLTEKLLRGIDYKSIRNRRNKNFLFLHKELGERNEFSPFINTTKLDAPHSYPFLRPGNTVLMNYLINKNIYVARYWPNITNNNRVDFKLESHIINNLISLPLDQRYDLEGLESVVELIKKF
jgi:hypothetical protein